MDANTVLTRSGVTVLPAPLRRRRAHTLREHRPRQYPYVAAVMVTVLIILMVGTDRWLKATTFRSLPSSRAPHAPLFRNPVTISITVSTGDQHAPWITTDEELRHNVEIWKRMHLADWNAVPGEVRAQGLNNMLRRYRHILNSPSAWDTMDTFDWDAVPQPVRTVAYRRMVAYWSGFYNLGGRFNLAARPVADTLAAIVMSESWFDHRARSVNRDGTLDIGLAQASSFARERLRALQANGRVDIALHEDDYYNPWRATRFVALWMMLMLEETNGDLDMAVRAYNRGNRDAADRLRAKYLAAVQRRLSRFIRNRDAPSSWDYLWRHAQEFTSPAAVSHR